MHEHSWVSWANHRIHEHLGVSWALMDFMSKSSNSCAFMGFMSIHEVHEQIIEFMSIYGFHEHSWIPWANHRSHEHLCVSWAFMDFMSKIMEFMSVRGFYIFMSCMSKLWHETLSLLWGFYIVRADGTTSCHVALLFAWFCILRLYHVYKLGSLLVSFHSEMFRSFCWVQWVFCRSVMCKGKLQRRSEVPNKGDMSQKTWLFTAWHARQYQVEANLQRNNKLMDDTSTVRSKHTSQWKIKTNSDS